VLANRYEEGQSVASGMSRKMVLACCIIVTILTGTLSRVVQTHNILFDKYLGDMLYAVLIYLLLSLVRTSATPLTKLLLSTIIMLLIEAFQLTGIPLSFRLSDSAVLQVIAIALGTKFALLDIIAYLAGIVVLYLLDRQFLTRRR
jgi:hypothetical protein